jgi:hypothetical protein
MNETEAKAKRVHGELVRTAIELQALGNRLMHLGPDNRRHGQAVRAQAAALARYTRTMGTLGMSGTAELFHFFDNALYLSDATEWAKAGMKAAADSEGGHPD